MSSIELPRLALANWDHSWLTRNDSRPGAYRQQPSALDALQERGYNALRIDAFPHLIAARSDGVVIDRFEVLSTQRKQVGVHPRHSLLELAKQAQQRNIRLWLSSGFLADSQSRRSFIRRPQDFINVWSQTLDLLKQEGLLDTVVAVDFCHHFPLPPAAHGASRYIFGSHPTNRLARLGIWSRGTEQRAEEYLLEVPRSLRALFPSVAFGVSSSAASDKHLRALDTSELDFIDSHLWLNDDPTFILASGGLLKGVAPALAARLQNKVAALAWHSGREQWQRHLSERIRSLHDFARVRRINSAVGAGFVQLAQEPRADWGWVREVCEFAVERAVDNNVNIICPITQARPHNDRLWQQTAWLQSLNQKILQR